LRDTWDEAADRGLVGACLSRQAPWLLALQDPDHVRRRRLERDAYNPLLLVQLDRTHPAILYREAVRTARIEARLGTASAEPRGRKETAPTAFFLTGNRGPP